MKTNRIFQALVLISTIVLSPDVLSQDSDSQKEKEDNTARINSNTTEASQAQAINDQLSKLEAIKTGDPIIDGIVSRYVEYIRDALASTRGLQDTVFLEANKIIESSIAFMDTNEFADLDDVMKENYSEWQEKAMGKLLRMVVLSSDEGTFDNNKQFATIEPRLIELQKILVRIQLSKSEETQKLRINQYESIALDTASDYSLLRRFNAGVGFTYNYLPNVTYSGIVNPNTRQYLSLVNATGTSNIFGTDLVRVGEFSQSFSNTAYPALTLAARMTFVSARLGLPFYSKDTLVNASDSFVALTDSNQRLIVQNQVETEFKPIFDISVSLSILELYEEVRDHYFSSVETRLGSKLSTQIDVGITLGMSAFQLNDKYTSDIRFVSEGSSFYDSTSLGIVTSEVERNLRPISYGLYFNLQPTDTITIGFDIKYYDNDTDGDFVVDVDGTSVSANFTYYFL